MDGILNIDKSTGPTSRDVVNLVQRILPRRTKIGHAGTLDPLATGVLILCVGAATKSVALIQEMSKTYVARIRFGATSTTDDADGTITASSAVREITATEVEAALPKFVGTIQQVPPAFSAIKQGGRRAYDLARRGDLVSLAARPVRIDAIRMKSFTWPDCDLEIDCGKGTYIRSLARDLGATLGVGGYIETLRRTRIGVYHADAALPLATIQAGLTLEALHAHLLPIPVR